MHQINLTETRRKDRTKELNLQIKADFRTYIRLNQEYLNSCSKKNLKKKPSFICRLSEKLYICCRYKNKRNENDIG